MIMPWKSQRRCGQPGCKELVDAGVGYCPKHKAKFARVVDQSHYGRGWQKVRTAYLSKHPLCHECEKAGKLTPGTEVHHIIPVASGGTDRDDNLQSLCKSCHSRITAKEHRFGW